MCLCLSVYVCVQGISYTNNIIAKLPEREYVALIGYPLSPM